MSGKISRMIRWFAEFAREVDRGLAVGYGHERPDRNVRLRRPGIGICRRLDRRCRKSRGLR